MADTINATYDGGICVPHDCLSGAKISIIPETSKRFTMINTKTNGRRPEIQRPLCIELLQ
jgi:hypothetical protein